MFYYYSVTWGDEEKDIVAFFKTPDTWQTVAHSNGKRHFSLELFLYSHAECDLLLHTVVGGGELRKDFPCSVSFF